MNIEIIERTHSILRVILFIVLIGSVVFLIAGIIGYKTWTECIVCVIISFILSSILRWLRIKIWNTYKLLEHSSKNIAVIVVVYD